MYKELPKLNPDEILMYLRKSRSDDPSLTVEQVLHNHETILNDWQSEHLSGKIPEENIYREVVSGETINSRPEFKKILQRIESRQIKAVLVVECERIGRPDLEEIGRISKLFRYTETLIITPKRSFDLSDEWDREQFERDLMRGNEYLEYTKKILKRGKDTSLRQGNFINAVVPYGYKREWIQVNKRKRPTLSIVESEAEIVKMIFNWYANEEIGALKIAQKLNNLCIPARKGGIWTKSSITHIIKNEHYTGRIVIRKHIDVKKVVDQEIITQCVLNEDYEIVDGNHPAIIDDETFNKANTRIRRIPSVKPSEKLQNPLASLLKCSCGKTMLRRKNTRSNEYRYVCDHQTFCGNASVTETELINCIVDKLIMCVEDLKIEVKNDDKTKHDEHAKYISMLKAKYIEQEKKEISLWDKYTDEQMPKQIFDKLLSECLEKKKQLETELETASQNEPVNVNYDSVIITLHQAIESLKNPEIPAEVTNKLLKTVIDKIVYTRPKAVRVSPEEAKQRGLIGQNGWYRSPFELDIYLKF